MGIRVSYWVLRVSADLVDRLTALELGFAVTNLGVSQFTMPVEVMWYEMGTVCFKAASGTHIFSWFEGSVAQIRVPDPQIRVFLILIGLLLGFLAVELYLSRSSLCLWR